MYIFDAVRHSQFYQLPNPSSTRDRWGVIGVVVLARPRKGHARNQSLPAYHAFKMFRTPREFPGMLTYVCKFSEWVELAET